MKKLSQILKECLNEEKYEFQKKIFPRASIAVMKNLAKHSKFQASRITVNSKGQFGAADAAHYLHSQINSNTDSKAVGFVHHKDGKYTYSLATNTPIKFGRPKDVNYGLGERYSGPEVERLHNAGIQHDDTFNMKRWTELDDVERD